MTIREFRCLAEVADCLILHEATRCCHASQFTFGIQPRKLEGYVDTRCFDRSRGGVGITGKGPECVRQVRILRAGSDAMRAFAARRGDGLAAITGQGRQSAFSLRRPEEGAQ